MLGWHLIFSTYGFWLPNDPRGSGSARVRAQHIYDAGGEATKVKTRQSVAYRPHDCRLRRLAKESLKYPAVEMSGIQARAVAHGIGTVVPKVGLTVYACAVLPDHVHLVVARHRIDGDELIGYLKRAGTRGLNEEKLNPMQRFPKADGRLPSPWGGRGWNVMLFTAGRMHAAIRYVEENPVRAGYKRQRWKFMVPFVGGGGER
jgi:REP element-mobilizing transposase RayT